MPVELEELLTASRLGAPPAVDEDRVPSDGIWPREYEAYAAMSEALRAERKHYLDLRYGPSPRHILDVYLPDEPVENAPVFIFFHGGALEEGHPRRYGYVGRPYLDRGAIYVSAGYRLMPPELGERRRRVEADLGGFVHQLSGSAPAEVAEVRRAVAAVGVDAAEDARAAIAWLYRNVTAFGGDPERITIGGHSSGAMVVVAAACADDWQAALGVPGDVVKAMVPVGGRYGLWMANALIGGGDVDDPPRDWNLRRAPRSVVVFAEQEYDDLEMDADDDRARDCARIGRSLVGALRAAGAEVDEVALSPRGHWQTVRSLGDPDDGTALAVLRTMGLQR